MQADDAAVGACCRADLPDRSLMFNADLLPIIAGFILLIAILVPNVLLWVTYRKYKRVEKALPRAEQIESAPAETLDLKRSALTRQLLDDWSRIPKQEAPVARQALWTAMLLEAAADGGIDHREMAFVTDLFGRIEGGQQEFRPVLEAAERVDRDRKGALAEIAKARHVSKGAKEQILAASFLVSVSDHALSERETDCLGAIADALSIKQRDLKTMLQGISRRFDL